MGIKFGNLKIWLKETFSRPGWYKDMMSYRRFWGALSVYSHKRRSDGLPNICYSTRSKAMKAVRSMEKKYGTAFMAYKCLYCDGWHVARCSPRASDIPAGTYDKTLYVQPTVTDFKPDMQLDHAAIMATGVPDLAPVYGGYRGRTLSSPRQAKAWPVLVSAGIRRIIDLRADYTADIYAHICSRYGVEYLHYPIETDDESISAMVGGFDEFCRWIDEGKFYISCAMGLHRTDIALSIYWVFHAADKGFPIPVLKGYVGRTYRRIGKVMRMLDLMYEQMSKDKKYGIPPREVFEARKKAIGHILTQEGKD